MTETLAETILPLLEERLRVDRTLRETGRVRVSVTTAVDARSVQQPVRSRTVEVERVAIDREVSERPAVREEGDTLVVPVLEEILVVERRLMLREEVRIRLRVTERIESRTETVLRQSAVVDRLPPSTGPIQHDNEESVMNRTITGMFDSRPEAERAVEHLVQQLGIDRAQVQVHAAGTENVTAGTTGQRSEDNHGFLASLRDMFLPDEDRASYTEGVRRGGILVTAEVPEARLEDAFDAFERNGAVDLDEREAMWKQEGWTGYAGDAVVGTSSDGSRTGMSATAGTTAATATGMPTTRTTAGMSGTTRALGDANDEERIQLVQEQLRIGKREVGGGRVRVRSYVVETPVSEQVMLREERVSIERRPVDRALTDADAASFAERTIEAVETSEEAVIAKDVRVTEELVIRKTAEERAQTVTDTVRRTEVEVDDDRVTRTGGTTTNTPATAPSNPKR